MRRFSSRNSIPRSPPRRHQPTDRGGPEVSAPAPCCDRRGRRPRCHVHHSVSRRRRELTLWRSALGVQLRHTAGGNNPRRLRSTSRSQTRRHASTLPIATPRRGAIPREGASPIRDAIKLPGRFATQAVKDLFTRSAPRETEARRCRGRIQPRSPECTTDQVTTTINGTVTRAPRVHSRSALELTIGHTLDKEPR